MEEYEEGGDSAAPGPSVEVGQDRKVQAVL